MKTILILGAGRSSSSLISYLTAQAQANDWHIVVGDTDLQAARARIENLSRAEAILFNIHDRDQARQIITAADVVVSLLPPSFHPMVALHCLDLKKHLLTASYVSDEMKALHAEAFRHGLLFLNECGLDPGLDHMSAMKMIDSIKGDGGKVYSFESFTGGLIAPETDPGNPWRYKFTWNPRNVVTAGQHVARYRVDGHTKYIPYQQLFVRTTPIRVPELGDFEGYANRDSLKYIDTYRLQGVQSMLRGTLRCKGFCPAWNILVQLGCCDDTYKMENVSAMTHRAFLQSFVPMQASVEKQLVSHFKLDEHGPEMTCLRWSGFFDDDIVGIDNGTPAQITEHILNKKWKLLSGDKDMIVMWHRLIYEKQNSQQEIQMSLVVKGDDSRQTAMAKTVGWPLAIAVKLLLDDKIPEKGVCIPVNREFYEPILRELHGLGVQFIVRYRR